LYRRPFASVAEMDHAMAARWNETVRPEDEVWHLGDFAVGLHDPGALLGRLHGRKRLVAGNNDGPAVCDLPGWESVVPYAEVTVEGVRLVLCHYPFRTWRGSGQGWLNLHGHSHGRLARMTRQHDVGVDVHDFRPVTLAALAVRRR
jgi:calcineurin-like phosphoesterase family protein